MIAQFDLAIIWSFYPSKYHDVFFKYYGEVEKPTWQYARFLGLYSGITLLLYASGMNDLLLRDKVIAVIKRINPNLIEND
ncbi:MAG: hypothetical protein AB7F64_01595 [Gammaproteobacteria bacterium]